MNTMPPMFLILVFYCFFKLISADCKSKLAGFRHESKEVFVGENVILPCTNVVKQTHCSKTTWQSLENGHAVEVVHLGKMKPEGSERRKRMSLTSNCSLHISYITLEDCDCYTCQQWNISKREVHDFTFCLYVTKGTPTTKSTTTREKKSKETSKKSGNSISQGTPTTKSTTTREKKSKETTKKSGNSISQGSTKPQTTKSTTTTKKNSNNTTKNSGTTTTPTTVTPQKNDLVISSVLVVVALSVTTFIVWLICRRRAHKRNNQNSNEHNDEDVTYTELNHNAVKLSKVGTDTKCQETVYSGIKCQ